MSGKLRFVVDPVIFTKWNRQRSCVHRDINCLRPTYIRGGYGIRWNRSSDPLKISLGFNSRNSIGNVPMYWRRL